MIRSQLKPSLTWFPLLIVSLLCLTAAGQIEDPSLFPGMWYRINIDTNGDYIGGDGDGYGGGTWYDYPDSDWYRMWYYNGPYDTTRKGELDFWAYIMPLDTSKSSSVEIKFNWTTPAWSALGLGRPPLPGDVPLASDEAPYIVERHHHDFSNVFGFESIEPRRFATIEDYNPEWVAIAIRGRNIRVYRWAIHECLPKDSAKGACCNYATGDCFIGYESDCTPPYTWLGAGSTCDQCTTPATLDFGDAPDPTYPTLLTHNGARHTIVAGIFLGQGVDAETNGQPNQTATGDDGKGADEDGVAFTSAIQPGQAASLDVTASTQGYLNAWMDFDGNGSFSGAAEQIFADRLLSPGVNHLTFAVPAAAAEGTTFARFRFNSRGLVSYDGLASDGEVEDYRVSIAKGFDPQPTSGLTAARWNQPPSLVDEADPYLFDGFTVPSGFDLHQIVADDCQFEDDRPITGVHWWGSFDGWTQPHLPPVLPLAFHIGIWSDVPDPQPGNPNTFNHPGTLLSETYCTTWTWAVAGFQQADKGGSGETCFLFSQALSQDQWFYPTTGAVGGSPESTFYWVSIAAVYDLENSQPEHAWGWMTRVHQSSASATLIQGISPASASPWPPTPGAQWSYGTLVQDSTKLPWDMAFQLTTYESPYQAGGTEKSAQTP